MKVFTVFIFLLSLCGCFAKQSGFSGSDQAKEPEPKAENEAPERVGKKPDAAVDSGATENIPSEKMFVKQSVQQARDHDIWQVLYNLSQVYLYTLTSEGKTLIKKWTYQTAGQGGTRTYVIEGGMIFTRSGGNIWYVSKDTPEGMLAPNSKNHTVISGVGVADRMCVVSYIRDGRRYIGGAHGAGKFVEIELENQPPYSPTWKVTNRADIGGARWGYSCYIDQDQLVFYSQWESTVRGIDLRSLAAVDVSATAKNANFISPAFPTITNPLNTNSYALSGDRQGNLFNATNYYTFSHDKVNDIVWATTGARNSINVFPHKCLTSDVNCTLADSYNLPLVGELLGLGPLSALRDGRITGQVRSSGKVFVFSLKDPKDISKGVDYALVGAPDNAGDPYMYTDFTGATLYLDKGGEILFDLTESKEFDAERDVIDLYFSWHNKKDTPIELKDVRVEMRCFEDEGLKGAFEAIGEVKNVGSDTPVKIESCVEKTYSKVEVRISQENGGRTVLDILDVDVVFRQ